MVKGKATLWISQYESGFRAFFVGSRCEAGETGNATFLYWRFLVLTAVQLRFPFSLPMTPPPHWVLSSGAAT
jgi:hypothetical protein